MEALVNEVIRAQDEQDLYFRCLKEIYRQYQPNHCLIAEFERELGIAHTLLYLCDGVLTENFSYQLNNTPCEEVFNDNQICTYSKQVQQQFPQDVALQHLKAESYIGVPIKSQEGSVIGVIALLYCDVLNAESFDHTWLLTLGFLIGKTILQQRLTREKERLLDQFQRAEQITQSCSWGWDVAANLFYCSSNLKTMFDIPAATELSFERFFAQYIFQSPLRYRQFISSAIHQHGVSKVIVDKDHSSCGLALELTFSRDYGDDGDLLRIEGNIKNITDFYQLENNYLLATKIIELSSNGVIVTDEDNRIRHMNAKAEQITGYLLSEVYGRTPEVFRSEIHSSGFYQSMWRELKRSGYWSGEVWNKTKLGVLYPEFLSITAVKDKNGITKNYIGVFDDISERKSMEKVLKQYENKQDFTGLLTRTQFVQHFEQHQDLLVVLIDIQQFSSINNLYGENFGNKVLRYIGLLLYRHFCGDGVDLCRYAADQFALSSRLDDIDEVDKLIDELREKVEKKFIIDGHQLNLNVNIGYALPSPVANSTHLLAQAYYALNSAKSQLSPSTVRYSEYLEQQIGRKYQLGVDLKQAIDERQLHVEYQPIFDTETEKVVKFEALARWTKDGEAISPFEFIPIAEELGYISQLGNLVLKIVCQDLRKLRASGYDDVKVSINRSIDELTDESLDNCSILKTLSAAGLSTSDIIIEITESVPLEGKPEVQELLAGLRSKGLKLALDDFGTGFASFSNLMRNTVDILKIDRTFIRDIETNRNNAVLVQSVNLLATQLGLDVIAEGVETQTQQTLLNAMGCRYIQGYYISKPVKFEQAIRMLSSQ